MKEITEFDKLFCGDILINHDCVSVTISKLVKWLTVKNHKARKNDLLNFFVSCFFFVQDAPLNLNTLYTNFFLRESIHCICVAKKSTCFGWRHYVLRWLTGPFQFLLGEQGHRHYPFPLIYLKRHKCFKQCYRRNIWVRLMRKPQLCILISITVHWVK